MKVSLLFPGLLLAALLVSACDKLPGSSTESAKSAQAPAAPAGPAAAAPASGTTGTDGAVAASSGASVVSTGGTATQSATVQATAGLDVGECPASAADFKEGKLYTCSCPAEVQADTVYGSGTYSMDSHICTAALHAGALQRGAAGRVNVQMVPSPEVFKSVTQNGIKSEPYPQAETAAYQVSAAK